MPGAVVVATLVVALIAGLTLMVVGSVALRRNVVALPWMRHRVRPKPWGWAQVFYGAFIVAETVPRLTGGSAGLVLALSIAATAPLIAAVMLQTRARLPRS